MKAIILAAGRGNRLQSVSEGTPKCMLQIGQRSIMHHQLASLQRNGVSEVVIVVGYKKGQVQDHAREMDGLDFTFIENPEYGSTNTAYSLWLCREHMQQDFLYLNGDVLFHAEMIRRLLHSARTNVLALDNKRCGAEEVKAVLDGDTVQHIGKKLSQEEAYGEFIGIGRFSRKSNSLFVEHLSYTVNDQMLKNEYFEYALNRLVKDIPFHYVDVSDIPCIEIDFPDDLDEAMNSVLPAIREYDPQS